MKLPVIRDACGNITNWFDTIEEAQKEMAYMGEEYELSEATIGEVFAHVFGGMTVEEMLDVAPLSKA